MNAEGYDELLRSVRRGWGMQELEFQKYYQKYYVERKTIQRIARKLSMGDEELYNDLVQTGLIILWEIEPTRASKNPDAWIRQAIKFKMIDYLRRNEPHKYESLDSRLHSGEQLEKDPASGELRLISSRRASRQDYTVIDHHTPRGVVEPNEDESYE